MRNILLIIRNILKNTFRKKGNIIIYLFLPLLGVLISLLMYGNSGPASLRIGVVNRDTGAFSTDMMADLRKDPNFKIFVLKSDEITQKLLNMETDAVIEIPEGFTESIYDGSPEKVGITSVKGQETTVWVRQRINSYIDTLNRLSAASGGNRDVFDHLYGQYGANPTKLTAVKLEDKLTGRNMALTSVGFLIMFVMLGAGFINMAILTEKRDRTYHRICSAPVSARQYIAGNALTSLLVVTLQILIIQVTMRYLLRIDTGISDIALFGILFLFGFVAIGIGLVVTAFSSSSYVASTLSTLVITPTCMLGGCFWDINMMPGFMQKIGYFVPQRWAINAIYRLQTEGAQSDITMNLLILAGFAAALFLVAIYRFARTGNVQKFV
jgi:ABC-2 type transport system permease protein